MADMRTVLVVGASGATGRLVVDQLLNRGHMVRAVIRSPDRLPLELRDRPGLSIIHTSLLEIDAAELVEHTRGCDAMVSCLGHNLTLRGVFGQPRRLVTETVRRLCVAVQSQSPSSPIRLVLMNSAGCRNRGVNEVVSLPQKAVVGLLRVLLPPHADNEAAGEYLRTQVGQGASAVEWVVVRPDALTRDEAVGPYTLHPSPTRSAIFNSGKTSRINVASFMSELVTDGALWETWRGRMPVIYNQEH